MYKFSNNTCFLFFSKKEIPQQNYVMHTMHCARNITLCKQCNEPIPKAQFTEHEESCRPPKPKKPSPPPIALEKSSYFQTRKAVEDKKIEARKERYMQRMDKLFDPGYSFRDNSQSTLSSVPSSTSSTHDYSRENSYGYSSRLQRNSGSSISEENGLNFPVKLSEPERKKEPLVQPRPSVQTQGTAAFATQDKSSGMLACKYCDLELPKLELEDHENYCGSRTDKCMECGELVMFKDKQAHTASNHSSAARRNNIGKLVLFDKLAFLSKMNHTYTECFSIFVKTCIRLKRYFLYNFSLRGNYSIDH